MSDKKQLIPVEIANLAVDALEKRIATLEAQKAALAAENERLRKAGDAMMHTILNNWSGLAAIEQWLAAKEGRDAK